MLIEHNKYNHYISIIAINNCQRFGQIQNYCFKIPKCVKYSKGYISLNYPKSKSKSNCGEEHTINWKSYSSYKNAVEKAKPKKLQQYNEYNKN